jgi:type III pantothenate kinase
LSNLVIDIGNTRTKAAVFRNDEMSAHFVWEKCTREEISEVIANHRVENVILSVVGPPMEESLRQWLASQVRFIELTPATRLPFQNLYGTPATLGKDRIAAVAGAFARFPGQNCLVIDAGTCITYDVLTAEGAYLGGNISPGIAMRFKALPAFTAALPQVERGAMEDAIGSSTETAIRNGVQYGVLWETDGMIAAMQRRIGDLNVVLTGGDVDFFVKNLKSPIFANAHLVLEGLNKILNYNV